MSYHSRSLDHTRGQRGPPRADQKAKQDSTEGEVLLCHREGSQNPAHKVRVCGPENRRSQKEKLDQGKLHCRGEEKAYPQIQRSRFETK